MAQNRLQVTDLDFDTIKTNLKSFLKQQTEFQDYDFEGSGLNVLVNLLAYNTHYNAYYLNMVANEAFLDTALLRDSVVSHAKTLGYVPYSKTAPTATINLTINSGNTTLDTLTIPKGYVFNSKLVDKRIFGFVVMNGVTVTKSDTSYYFENLEIKEGQLLNYTFNYDESANPKSIFTLPDMDIDTSTITVSVNPSTSNTSTTVYNKVTDILDVGADSAVFYLQESKGGKYQIYFGNGTVGRKIEDGSVISVGYLSTNGTLANKVDGFGMSSAIGPYSTGVIQVVSVAGGGSDRETVDEIKSASPVQFATQNRLVTKVDYESYIKKNYPSIDSLSVWGGEDEIPPIYGKVLISLKPKENYYITESEKTRIINEIIKPKAIVSVSAEIRDPEYLYLILNSVVKYDERKTSLNENTLRTLIRNGIIGYKNTYLNKFNSVFALSKLQDEIDHVSFNGIIGSETVVRLQKRFQPEVGTTSNYTINFGVPLHRGTITNRMTSSEFTTVDNSGVSRTAVIEEIPQSSTGISSIEISNAGYGFQTVPTVTITGDGVGATAVAVIQNGRITEIKMTNRGSDYSRAVVTITGGDGYNAAASAVIDTKVGTIRTIYYDSTANRQVINPSVGTINYSTGVITINDLRILAVATSDGLIRLSIESESGIIESIRNTIITIDETDPSAVATQLLKVNS
jgi:hypothetical protein